MEEDALALQDDELTALEVRPLFPPPRPPPRLTQQSIYPGLVTIDRRDADEGSHTVSLSIPITLAHPTPTHLVHPFQPRPSASSSSSEAALHLTHLPALSARIVLPPGYPLSEPPRVESLRAPLRSDGPSSAWLSKRVLANVQERLAVLWADEAAGGQGVGVLWSWWEWVGSGQFLEDLGLLVDHTLT